jgi:seryl-tRNA synthetase
MIDLKSLEKNEPNAFLGQPYLDGYRTSLKNRGADPGAIEALLELNKSRKALLHEAETLKSKQNKVGEEIAVRKRKKEDASQLLKEMQTLSEETKRLETAAQAADDRVTDALLQLPNVLHRSVPVGFSSEDNKVVRTVGEVRPLNFKAKEHGEIGESLRLIDFERATKTTGARFAFLRGAAARLERALIQFMMDVHSDVHGYEEMIPPFFVNSTSLRGTGQFPKFKADVFAIESPELYPIPTAEVPVTNFFAEEVLDLKQLPISFVAYSPCFRSEAGSHGKDTKGLIRQHQFNKVELVKFTHPEQSEAEHEKLTSHAEEILKRLELPYRVMALCSGDIGFGAMKCYDLEVWLPGQGAYREISSCSNFGDFQARRANIRFKDGRDAKAKPQFVHTINGSGLAVGRTLIALLENGQQPDGSVILPRILEPYVGQLHLRAP